MLPRLPYAPLLVVGFLILNIERCVSTQCTGTIHNPFVYRILNKEQTDQFLDKGVNSTPMGRRGTSDEVARAVLFFASDDSSYITGIELFVDGGVAQI